LKKSKKPLDPMSLWRRIRNMNKLPEELFETIPATTDQTVRKLKYPKGKVPYEELKKIIELQDREFLISLGNANREWIYRVTDADEWEEESLLEKKIFINKQMLENFCYEYGWDLDDFLEATTEDYNNFGL
jgi:hypothetical protein